GAACFVRVTGPDRAAGGRVGSLISCGWAAGAASKPGAIQKPRTRHSSRRPGTITDLYTQPLLAQTESHQMDLQSAVGPFLYVVAQSAPAQPVIQCFQLTQIAHQLEIA